MNQFQSSHSNNFRLFILASILLGLIGGLFGGVIISVKAASEDNPYVVYLPLVTNVANQQKSGPVLLGIYPSSYWQPMVTDALTKEFNPINQWSGKQLSLAGVFHFFYQSDAVPFMLTEIWNGGYTPFVNIYSDHSIQDIAAGGIDNQIRSWARGFATFANNGQRMAFLAPLQEMNGTWVPYGSSNPAYFKTAYQRIINIFEQEGVPSESVRWVFAPNGWSSTGWPGFEDYYPGDDIVDVVGFSAYNYGYSAGNPYPKWETPQQLYQDFVNRIRVMAPSKPVFIAQTGSTTYGPSGYDINLKNQWLTDAYSFAVSLEGVRGIIYYNANMKYDWAFYKSNLQFNGYVDGVAQDYYKYVSPMELQEMNITP